MTLQNRQRGGTTSQKRQEASSLRQPGYTAKRVHEMQSPDTKEKKGREREFKTYTASRR